MPDLVRARVGNIEKTVGRDFAEVHGLEVLDEPAHTPDGHVRPDTRAGGRPRKPKTTVASAAAKKAVTQSADDQKEQDQ